MVCRFISVSRAWNSGIAVCDETTLRGRFFSARRLISHVFTSLGGSSQTHRQHKNVDAADYGCHATAVVTSCAAIDSAILL
jgi:hypothetical protein